MVDFDRFSFDSQSGRSLRRECCKPVGPRRHNWGLPTKAVETTNAPMDFARAMHRLPEPRRQLIFRVRRQLAEGTYLTDEKLECALERMFDHLLDPHELNSDS